MKRLFLINLVILCSRIGLQNLTICPLPVFSTQNLRQKKNHSSALNENTYLFHQHFSKTKLHIIIYFWIILFHNHLEKSPQMKKKTKNWCQLCHKRLFNVSPSLRVAQIFDFFNSRQIGYLCSSWFRLCLVSTKRYSKFRKLLKIP